MRGWAAWAMTPGLDFSMLRIDWTGEGARPHTSESPALHYFSAAMRVLAMLTICSGLFLSAATAA